MKKVVSAIPFSFALLALLFAPAVALSGEFNFLTEHPGKVSTTVTAAADPKLLSKADGAAFKRNMERLRSLLLKQPVFNPPRGVEVIGYMRPNDYLPKTTKVPVPGFGYLRFHFYFLAEKTQKPARICCTTDEIFISVNDPDQGFDGFGGSGYPSKVFYEPVKVGEFAGYPIFRMEGGDDVIVLSRKGVDPWVPVTREEYITAGLKSWQKHAAETSMDTISPQVVRRHQAALDAMTPAERKMQARYYPYDPFEPTLAPVGSDEGRPLLRTNPAWFDPSLPRGAFQLVIIHFGYSGNLNHEKPGLTEFGDISPYRVWQALHTSDWSEIATIVKEK